MAKKWQTIKEPKPSSTHHNGLFTKKANMTFFFDSLPHLEHPTRPILLQLLSPIHPSRQSPTANQPSPVQRCHGVFRLEIMGNPYNKRRKPVGLLKDSLRANLWLPVPTWFGKNCHTSDLVKTTFPCSAMDVIYSQGRRPSKKVGCHDWAITVLQ